MKCIVQKVARIAMYCSSFYEKQVYLFKILVIAFLHGYFIYSFIKNV